MTMGNGPDVAEQPWNGCILWPAPVYNELQPNDDHVILLTKVQPAALQADGASPAGEEDLQSRHALTGQQPVHNAHERTSIHVKEEAASVQPFMVEDEQLEPGNPVTSLLRLVWTSGTACMLLAAFIFSLSALAVKLTGGRVPVLQITLIRSSLSWVVSAVAIKARGIQPMFGQRKHVGWMIARGVTGALAMISFYVAILMLPLADAMTLFFLNPSMTAIAAWAIRGEPLGLLGATGCTFSLIGLVVLTHPPMLFGGHEDWGAKRVLGTLMGVTSAVWATGAFISIRFIGKAEPAIVVALYFHTSTMLLSAIPLLIGWPSHAVWLSWFDAAMLLAVAATSFAGQLLLTRGFQLESAGKAAGLNFSQVLYSYIFGILFFQEHLTVLGVTGTALIALGMGCVASRNTSPSASGKSDTMRDAAGAGVGSCVFTSSQLQDRSSDNSSFLARFESFQRLLGRGRGYAAVGVNAGSDSLLHIEEQLSWQQRNSGTGGSSSSNNAVRTGRAGAAAGASRAGETAAVAEGVAADCMHMQHQHVHSVEVQQEEQQQQQQQHGLTANPSGAAAVLPSGAGTVVLHGKTLKESNQQQEQHSSTSLHTGRV